MSSSNSAARLHGWLQLGIAWFLLGMAFSPTDKLYQQGMVGFIYLPAAIAVWVCRRQLLSFCSQHVFRVSLLSLFFLWAVSSLAWRETGVDFQDGKRVLYIVFFAIAFLVVGIVNRVSLYRILIVAAFGIAASAMIAIVKFYFIDGHPLPVRLVGLGGLDHPIRGGYVVGVCAAILACSIPRARASRVLWILALTSCVLFMALTQSRGVWVAFVGLVMLLPLWRHGPIAIAMAVVTFVLIFLGYLFFEPIISARGMSFRTEILEAVIPLILERPLTGYGMQAAPSVYVERVDIWFPHTHNMFAHIALELGVFGLGMWIIIWVLVGLDGWRHRETPLGSMLLAIWIYATLVSQFSLGVLWDTPRAQWVITWLPIALWLACLVDAQRNGELEPLNHFSNMKKR